MYGGVPAEWIIIDRVSSLSGEIFPHRKYHKEGDLPDDRQILVFGSNTGGRHGKGSARLAALRYGAIEGQARGRMDRCFAIPTRRQLENKWIISLKLEEIEAEVQEFVDYTVDNPFLRFFVMGVGTRNAGFTPEQIAPFFRGALNCSFPDTWKEPLMQADSALIKKWIPTVNPL